LRETEEALPALYRLSRRLRRIIAQNLAWAFGYNLIALPLAMGLWPGVYVSPGLSALLMSLSSLTVVLNSLRVRLHPTP
jgi:Cu2+-exporting ATPase